MRGSRPSRWSDAAAALLLAVATAAAYLPVLRAGFIWDDDTFLTQNRLIRAADGLRRFWFTTQAPDYFPVTYSPLWVEWRLWGLHAAGYHAVNLGLHIAGCLLLWAVLRRLRLPGAFLAALLFAVHPVNVESVAWITQRKNLMALVFYLLAVLAYLRWKACCRNVNLNVNVSKSEDGWNATSGRVVIYTLSLVLFAAAMLSKGSVAMLPFVLLGVIAWRRRPTARDILSLLPFFLVSAILVLADIWFQRHGAHEVFRSAGPVERLLGAGAVVWFYLGKAVAPIHLAFIYPQWAIHPRDPRWWIPLAAAAALTIWLWRRRRGPARGALFAWGYFCASLVPVMGFADVQFMQYSLVADHYSQLALAGVIAYGVGTLTAGAARGWRRLATGALWALVPLFAVLTWRQCSLYRDPETLYRATLARNPDCWLAQSNLGSVLFRSGRVPEAIGHFEAALRLKPDLFEAQNDLGLALTTAGHPAEALEHFQRATGLHPDNAAVYYNAATALSEMGRLPEAAADYRQALRLSPSFAPAHQDLGAALAQLGRLPEAMDQFREALRLRPDYFEAQADLGLVLAQIGRNSEARLHLEQALKLEPGNGALRAALARLPPP